MIKRVNKRDFDDAQLTVLSCKESILRNNGFISVFFDIIFVSC